MDVFEIKHNTRPDSVPVYSKEARKQVTRLIAALAHDEADDDDISRARVSEAQSGLLRVMALDDSLKKFRGELDNALGLVQDRFYKLQDDLQKLTPAGLKYTVPTSKGTTNVQPQGQAKLPRPTTPTSVSAGGNPQAVGAVRPTGKGAGLTNGTVERIT